MGENRMGIHEMDEGMNSLGGIHARGIHNSNVYSNVHDQPDDRSLMRHLVESSEFVLNVTVTFDPYKFEDMDTIWEGPKEVKRILEMKQKYWEGYYFLSEKHNTEMSRNRVHLHGQISIKYDVNRFDAYDNLIKFMNKKIGNVHARWNKEELETTLEGKWKSYWDYCHKESENWTIYGFAKRRRPREMV